MHNLTGFQRDCLVAVAGVDDSTEVEVERKLDSDQEGETDHGRRCPNLDTLVERGRRDERADEHMLTRRGQRQLEARDERERQRIGVNR
ncbi:PadR family transcriptional regulator [Halorientalis sp.]|jgi:hypothetical protein|uniref:PadR family transcriptional regulator n=1 Tax=Halorientalis sp. TaxID=1931229 RepID=UPI00262180DC|nr:PadR family transcriptional regulator [Halorientalis sp.]